MLDFSATEFQNFGISLINFAILVANEYARVLIADNFGMLDQPAFGLVLVLGPGLARRL